MTGSVSVGVFVTLGRTDFPVSGEDLHRNFASVAIGTRVLTPGTGGALGVFARDQVTGWFYSIIDSEESDIGHRFVIGAGLYFGT